MAVPPSPVGVITTEAELFPRPTLAIVGALGSSPAWNGLDGSEASLAPNEFVATTVHV